MIIDGMNRNSVAMPLENISSARREGNHWIVVDVQGEEHRVDKIAWDIAVESPRQAWPALPGTYLICPIEGEGDQVYRQNVVGWSVGYDSTVRPVVVDVEGLMDRGWTVLFPDGRVEVSTGGSWENLSDWLAAQLSEQPST